MTPRNFQAFPPSQKTGVGQIVLAKNTARGRIAEGKCGRVFVKVCLATQWFRTCIVGKMLVSFQLIPLLQLYSDVDEITSAYVQEAWTSESTVTQAYVCLFK